VSLSLTAPLVAAIAVVVLVGGTINGLAGFGFAVVSTMALAALIDPAVAVAFVIVPLFAVNLTLVGQLSRSDLDRASRRFAPLVVPAVVGSIAGMVVLDSIPQAPLRVGLGLVALAFVVSVQETVPVPGLDRAKAGCFVETGPAMAAIGAVGGLLFGATNVGVQLVAYVRSCDLRHGLFVGVVALVFLSLNTLRVLAAGLLGLYPSPTVAGLSVLAAVPAVVGVAVGSRLRHRVSERARRTVVLGLLTVIATQLLLTGGGLL
jgi:uncharacterized membrane protein YfcA